MQNENSWKVFYGNVRFRCEKLIEYGIWQGIDPYRLKMWLNNFKTDREKLFSALVLDSLIFRSEEQVKSMLYDLFTKDLHNIWRIKKDPLYTSDINPLNLLKRRHPDIKFRIITTVKSTDPSTKSGYHMVHLLNHFMDVRSEWTIKVSEIEDKYKEGIRCFILLDDISCTGEQLNEVLKEIDISQYTEARFYILLCTIHEKARLSLSTKYPNVSIVYTEYLDDSNNFFDSISLKETNYKDRQEAIDRYKEFLKDKKILFRPPLGKGDLGLTYAFCHNVPNNSLPILHYENDNFKKLITKRP